MRTYDDACAAAHAWTSWASVGPCSSSASCCSAPSASPLKAVLGFYTASLRHREEDLKRAFFSSRHARVLDALWYVRFMDWRLYGEEALVRREAAVWL